MTSNTLRIEAPRNNTWWTGDDIADAARAYVQAQRQTSDTPRLYQGEEEIEIDHGTLRGADIEDADAAIREALGE